MDKFGNDFYNKLLKIIKTSKDKKEIAKCCQLYSRLFSIENKLKKNIQDIDKLLESRKPDPTDAEISENYDENIVEFS